MKIIAKVEGMAKLVAFAILLAGANFSASAADETDLGGVELSQLETLSSLDGFKPSEGEFRIYFIGDSITRHGTNAETRKWGWDHVAGMSASSESKDYAHLLGERMRQALPGTKVRLFFGRGMDASTALSGMEAAKIYRPDLVVVQLGEHVPPSEAKEKTYADYTRLLDTLLALPSTPMIVCSGVWNSEQRKLPKYRGHTAEIESAMKEACEAKGVAFASVEKHAINPACSQSGDSAGLKWHPNDVGHAGYAAEIFAAIESPLKERRKGAGTK